MEVIFMGYESDFTFEVIYSKDSNKLLKDRSFRKRKTTVEAESEEVARRNLVGSFMGKGMLISKLTSVEAPY